MKGADVVMTSIVQYNDWLDEEVNSINTSENQFHSFEIGIYLRSL
jgi:hypothetical protein